MKYSDLQPATGLPPLPFSRKAAKRDQINGRVIIGRGFLLRSNVSRAPRRFITSVEHTREPEHIFRPVPSLS